MQVMIKKLWLLCIVMILLVFLAGCNKGDANPGTDTTNDTEGEETVTPGDNTPDGGDAKGKPASSSYFLEGEGFKVEHEGWNCAGLVGEWNWRYTLDIIGYGTIFGSGTSTVPTRPASGPWLTIPSSYTISGTLNMDGATAEVSYIFEDVVLEIITITDGPTMFENYSGKGTAIVKVVTPEASFVVSETYFAVPSGIPSAIIFGPHPECN
jgi:hypothetical protein